MPTLTVLQLYLGTYAEAQDINDSGLIVGTAGNASDAPRAVKWTSPTGPPTLLEVPTGATQTRAFAVNGSGTVCGSWNDSGGTEHACVWNSAGNVTTLDSLGGTQDVAYGINDSGYVVGVSNGLPTLWDAPTNPVALTLLTGDTAGIAYDIDNAGSTIVGQSGTDACVWESGTPTALDTATSYAYRVNNSSQAVGQSSTLEAARWDNWTPATLSPLSGHTTTLANGINDDGLSVGWDKLAFDVYGVLWDGAGSATELPGISGGLQDVRGFAINSSGAIVGRAMDASADFQAVGWDLAADLYGLGIITV